MVLFASRVILVAYDRLPQLYSVPLQGNDEIDVGLSLWLMPLMIINRIGFLVV